MAITRKPKGKPDLRKIRLGRCYTVPETASLLGVAGGTIRAWIRRGLPVLEGNMPLLIPGDGLKGWLKARLAARKQKCLPDELYCCRCRRPRKPKPGSVAAVPRNAKTVAIRAQCGTCEAKMNRAGSLARLMEIKAAFGLETPAQESLAGCENLAVNQHLEKETAE
jgi:hypothetical protein